MVREIYSKEGVKIEYCAMKRCKAEIRALEGKELYVHSRFNMNHKVVNFSHYEFVSFEQDLYYHDNNYKVPLTLYVINENNELIVGDNLFLVTSTERLNYCKAKVFGFDNKNMSEFIQYQEINVPVFKFNVSINNNLSDYCVYFYKFDINGKLEDIKLRLETGQTIDITKPLKEFDLWEE